MSMVANFLRVPPSQLEAFKADSELLAEHLYNQDLSDDPTFLDIDKSWDGIAFLLTGQNAENARGALSRIIFSGQFVDEEQDLGYGPAHYLRVAEVKALSDEISKIDTVELKKRFDPAKMKAMEIYPEIWDEGETAFEYLKDNFRSLQRFFEKAAAEYEVVISVIN